MTSKLKIPTEVIDSDWRDDIDYQPFENEKTYISPSEVSHETISRIKKSPIKLSIEGLWKWEKEGKQAAA